MSILIKGMTMPEDCFACPLETEHSTCGFYTMRGEARFAPIYGRRDDCPLIEPPPHGDLIDRDVLKEAFCGNCFADEKPMECSEPCMDIKIILEAPTIIEAEEEE